MHESTISTGKEKNDFHQHAVSYHVWSFAIISKRSHCGEPLRPSYPSSSTQTYATPWPLTQLSKRRDFRTLIRVDASCRHATTSPNHQRSPTRSHSSSKLRCYRLNSRDLTDGDQLVHTVSDAAIIFAHTFCRRSAMHVRVVYAHRRDLRSP